MATSYNILEALDKQANLTAELFKDDEKHQFIVLLSSIADAEDEKSREDAVDLLDDFCLKFPVLYSLLMKLDDAPLGGNRGKPSFDVSEEERIQLFANRLIKATEESLSQDAIAKEKKEHEDD